VKLFLGTSALAILFAATSFAEPPRVLPAGELPKDDRLGPPKDLDGYFPFTPPTSREAWEKRAERVRIQMRVALGIWPEPTRTPLNAVIHGRFEGDDYTVEKVFFESMPDFFVTGNLYRPKGTAEAGKKRPAVLCPHGHWDEARFRLLDDAALKKELETGGERLAQGGRSIFQSLGVQLARMGCVAFVYDMLGYCDSRQISQDIAHKFSKQRPEMNARSGWGLFSPRAEAYAQSVMGLQTWNSMRALDFLTSLPDVDPARLGCTGASGGGTQTMIVAALDPRIAVECPAVMVSTAMQGGCTCENASLLRVATGNIEFAALFAPKPLGMTAADDWTKEMPTKGFPELQRHYAVMGAPENVQLWPFLQFPHNYNAPSREAIYAWFNKHFGIGLPEPIREREYKVLSRDELTVWDAQHPAPPGGPDFERELLKWWHDDAQLQFINSTKKFREIAAPAWNAIIGRTLEDAGNVVWEERKEPVRESKGGKEKYRVRVGLLRNTTYNEELPALILERSSNDARVQGKPVARRFAVWLAETGKKSVFSADGTTLRPEVQTLVDAGASVLAIDCLSQGEFLTDNTPITQARKVKNPREAAAYTYGYNPPLFAQRVHDTLTAIRYITRGLPTTTPANLVAFGAAGPIAAAARAIAGGAVDCAIIDSSGFQFADVSSITDPNFLPAAAKYGDVAGLLALSAPGRTFVISEGPDAPELARATYVVLHAGQNLEHAKPSPKAPLAAIDWLLYGSTGVRRIAE
jgi:hypothetical protein